MKGYNKALFLDLDGTIIRTRSGDEHPQNKDDWEFIEGILPTVKRYAEQGYIVCIVTNQGGIELGHVVQSDFEDKIKRIEQEMEQYIHYDVSTAYSPNMNSYYRKPKPGMAYHFAITFELDLSRCIMVGDTVSDSEFAKNAGIGGYLNIGQFIS